MNTEIQEVLNKNMMEDLHRFLAKRQCLNSVNMYMNYIFHFIQTAGVLTTAIAESYGWSNIVWVGVGLNSLATLIHVYEHSNNKILEHMMQNIKKIKNGTYLDESALIDDDDEFNTKSMLTHHAVVSKLPTVTHLSPPVSTPLSTHE